MTTPTPTAPEPAGYQHLYSGKVRDLYVPLDPKTGQAREDQLLMVASDRISAFDFVLDPVIPDKGRILTQLSLWWFEQLADLAPHHVISADAPEVPAEFAGRGVLVRKLQMLPVECIARAYLTGSGLSEYRQQGSVSGVPLPPGLDDAARLDGAIFTPTTKAPMGEHDQPMTYDEVVAEVGVVLASRVRELTVAVLARGNEIASRRGILIADTKVEFGLDPDRPGDVMLADEVLTPDSSRFWRANEWSPGHTPTSYSKQYVRDWLTSPESGWDRRSGEAPPELPEDVVAQTRDTYVAAYEAITGENFQ